MAEKQLAEYSALQLDTAKFVEVFAQNPTQSLKSEIFNNYVKSGVLPDFANAQAEFFLHKGMMTLKIDREHFIMLSEKLPGGFETVPDGFLYDATMDQAGSAIMKYIVRRMAIIPSDTREQDIGHFLDHESKHYRNKYTFPEYLLKDNIRFKKLDSDVIKLKEEITAGIEEGQNANDLIIRLYGQDIYNRHNALIKQQARRLSNAEADGNEAEAQEAAKLIEKVKGERKQYAQWLIEMLQESYAIMQQEELGSDLLAVTPAHHWQLFTEGDTVVDLETAQALIQSFDQTVDSYGKPKIANRYLDDFDRFSNRE